MITPNTLSGLLIFLLSFLLTASFSAFSQVSGCKDSAATNYNASATVNDGSCTYNSVMYTPPVRADISSVLTETSGLQWAGNFLWSFNDGGNATAIYRMDTASNAILQTVNLEGTTNVDWEDIGFDGTHFYIGDFGNNADGARVDLKIYKFPLAAIPDYTANPVVTIASADIDIIYFTYSGQLPVVPTTANNTRFDCEAMIVDAGKIHLFTKNWVDLNTVHYIINSTSPGTYVATELETLATNYLVTGADKTPAGNVIVLLGYQASGFGNHFMHLLSDFSGGLYFNGNKRRIDLPSALLMGQAEGICFRNNTYGYISNEGITSPVTVTQKLRSFNTSSFVPLYVLPTNLLDFNVRNGNEKQQIDWRFTEPAKELIIFQSRAQSSFTELKRFKASQMGSITIDAAAGKTCYQLSWEETDRSRRSSHIICLDKEMNNQLGNLALRRSGTVSFVFNGNEPGNCLFRLLSTDGKMIAQTTRFLTQGSHTLQLNQSLKSGIFILQLTRNGKQESLLVRVE